MKLKDLLKQIIEGCEASLESEVIFTDKKTGQQFKITSVGYVEEELTLNLNNLYD